MTTHCYTASSLDGFIATAEHSLDPLLSQDIDENGPMAYPGFMAASAEGKDLWIVGGGDLAGKFADAGLLDEVWVQCAPAMLASGAPLLPRQVDLELIDVARNRSFMSGRYRVTGSGAL